MRTFGTLALTALAALTMAVTPVAAHVPGGNGHSVVAGGLCEDGSSFDIQLVPGSGATAWRLGAEQDHHVVGLFSISTYFDGQLVASETKTWGKKSGLDPLDCDVYFADGAGLEILIHGTIYPLPG